MQLYSTKNKKHLVDLKEAVLNGLPPDNGLYMPSNIPELPKSLFESIHLLSFQEIAKIVASNLIGNYITDSNLSQIVSQSITFDAPVINIHDNISSLELFHGPSLAFKDFGARFMAKLMSYFNRGNDKELTILVATSGDTGGAVASGFYKTPGIRVVILYPSGKVSPLQEKQLTTLGHNIQALEIDGTFDDCQTLVKKAFLDDQLNSVHRLSSANSINIARLIPQSFYYFEAYKQLEKKNKIVFSVPSGNFGNLTAGLFAKRMGLPVHQFIASTNVNNIVPQYFKTKEYQPKKSIATLSNAMDVGNPSNFVRMMDLYDNDHSKIVKDISGYFFTDEQTREVLKRVFHNYNYLLDPHGAVAYLGLKSFIDKHPGCEGVLLETAHPSKFLENVENIVDNKIKVPERLSKLKNLQKEAIQLSTKFEDFKDWLNNY